MILCRNPLPLFIDHYIDTLERASAFYISQPQELHEQLSREELSPIFPAAMEQLITSGIRSIPYSKSCYRLMRRQRIHGSQSRKTSVAIGIGIYYQPFLTLYLNCTELLFFPTRSPMQTIFNAFINGLSYIETAFLPLSNLRIGAAANQILSDSLVLPI